MELYYIVIGLLVIGLSILGVKDILEMEATPIPSKSIAGRKYKLKSIRGLYNIRRDRSLTFEAFRRRLERGYYEAVGEDNSISLGMINEVGSFPIPFSISSSDNIYFKDKMYYKDWCDVIINKNVIGGNLI